VRGGGAGGHEEEGAIDAHATLLHAHVAVAELERAMANLEGV
jgi:hypothetical protein